MTSRTWTFAGEHTVYTYQDEVRGGITYSTMISSRPRTPEDPPFKRISGTWKQKGKAHIFTPAPHGCPEAGPSNICEVGGCPEAGTWCSVAQAREQEVDVYTIEC
jgi:hypothetical protein